MDYKNKCLKLLSDTKLLDGFAYDFGCGTGTGLDFSCLKEIPKNFNKPILIMGGAGKPEHFTQAFAIKNISGVVTANLFNFLGSGLRLVREHSAKNGVKLIKFN